MEVSKKELVTYHDGDNNNVEVVQEKQNNSESFGEESNNNKLRKSFYMLNDGIEGEDYLDLGNEAAALATYLFSAELQPPFVLGILGNWGAGKSFFFNMMKDELINLQKERFSLSDDDEMKINTVGHLYVIKFDAWTYGKQNLWASMMYCILKSLNEQMEIEKLIRDGVGDQIYSVIELYEKLHKNEIDYLEECVKDEKMREKIIKSFNKGTVSDALGEVFENDKKELDEAIKELNKAKWEDLSKHGPKAARAMNAIEKIVVWKIKALASDKEALEKILGNSVEENYKEFSLFLKFFARFLSIKPYKIAIWIVMFLIILAIIYLIEPYYEPLGRFLNNTSKSVITFVTIFIAPFLWFYRKTNRIVKFAQDNFSKEINELNAFFDEEHASARPLNKEEEEILKVKSKIKATRKRIRVLQGESICEVLKNRVNSDYYLDKLGIIHQVKEDLSCLSDAIYNKKYQDDKNDENRPEHKKLFPHGEPRIILFVDDLDRCDPSKVIEVLEAIQLVVNLRLFVVVVAIDPTYVCQSLESGKYKDILRENRNPTGMDFLEKIIQVPFRLPNINQTNMTNLINKLVEVEQRSVETVDTILGEAKNETLIEENIEAFIENQKKVVLETMKFTTKERDMLVDCLSSFPLPPRSVKRLTNVFKIFKDIRQRRDKKSEDNIDYNFLLLIVLASSEKHSFQMQHFFKDVILHGIRNNSSFPQLLKHYGIEVDHMYDDRYNMVDPTKKRNVIQYASMFSFYREPMEEVIEQDKESKRNSIFSIHS